jgi:transposase
VIGPSGNVRVMVATKPVDFRKGSEGLAALVRETMRLDPFSGVVYVFRAKGANFTSFSIPFAICRGGVSLASASR